jgi:RimJ/RimL family protein N-acetyltransferase
MQTRVFAPRYVVSRLHDGQQPEVLAHLVGLCADDRVLRFEALTSDATLATYVSGIDFQRDCCLGLRDQGGRLVGFAHIANYGEAAELGISVDRTLRGLGCGERLMIDGLRWAKLSGFRTFVVLTSKANHAMLGLAKKYGARTSYDGGSACAEIDLAALPEARLFGGLAVADAAETEAEAERRQPAQAMPRLGLAA